MTFLYFWVLCSKWLSPLKRFFGVFPQTVFYIGFTCRFFGQMAVASEKVPWRVPPKYSSPCLPNECCFIKGSLEGSADTALHLSHLLGSKLRELVTCLTHTNSARRKQPIMSLLLGYSLGLFCIFIFLKNRMADVWQTSWHEFFVGNSACWHFGFQVCANLR